MLVKYKLVSQPDDPRFSYDTSKEYYTKQKIENYCCQKMQKMITEKEKINFDSNNGKLLLNLWMRWLEDPHEEEFDYCPWCGEKIEIRIVERTKKILKFKEKVVEKKEYEFMGSEEVPFDEEKE